MSTARSRSTFVRLLLCVPATVAVVSVPRWFGDNMVFQSNAEYGARSFINGKARPGEHVSVEFGKGLMESGGAFPAVADANGDWEVEFNRAGQ